ncbi:MAG: cation diffusion facilitator family transporter, partial [Rhodobacteraceae bacterium]|nr:cation diffusion facilitator family transporter [Paracoccaceae bacterium]
NAWHHRSDALSSVVAMGGIGAAMAGFPGMDALAAALIAVMLGRLAWDFGTPAVAELVDAAPHEALAEAATAALSATPGVRDVHDLLMRRSGGRVQADVHLGLDPDLTLSEAHRLCEAARARVLAELAEIEDIVIHPEPHGHADGFGAYRAALRPAVRATVERCLGPLSPEIVALQLDYSNEGIMATAIIGGAVSEVDSEAAQARLAELRSEGRTDVVSLRVLAV